MSSFPKNSIGISWEPFSHPSFESIGIRGQHAFIIYTDEKGINHVLEHGDPYYSYDNPNLLYDGSLKNYLRYRIGILDDTTYPHPEGAREQINSDGVIFKSSASFPNWKASDTYFSLDIPVENQKLVWEEMKEHARAIKDSRTPYQFGLQGPVSNSVIASILADIGFSLEEITGVSIPSGLTLSDSASIGMAIAFGEVSMNDLGYGGISNTVSHVKSGNISGLTHSQIRGFGAPTNSESDITQTNPLTVADSIGRLYTAAFGRKPDDAGLQYWINVVSDPLVSYKDVSQNFVDSPEFSAIAAPEASSEVFTSALYQNVLGREPDPSGLVYWTTQLDSGMQDRADVLMGFANSPENIALYETLA